MCGICGEFNFSGAMVDSVSIRDMMQSLVHRGPDDSGMYNQSKIGMGHQRLSILDLSAKGRQPIWSQDNSLCIVFNGEVYNYLEIRADLKSRGYRFHSDTDTEVVVNSIHCYGIEHAIRKFIGMFAFAVWDSRSEKLTLCRDRAGIKPLYYYIDQERLLFGSELKALMAHPGFKKEIDITSLGQYFITGYFLDTHTVFANAYKLSPGCYMTVDQKGKKTTYRYWDIENFPRNGWQIDFKTTAERLESLLVDAFQYRLISDVPVGLFLSGGIDSSLVSALLKKHLKTDIINITIGFNEAPYDEAPKARRVSQQLGVQQIVHRIDVQEAQDTLLKLTEIYDEPFGDTSGIPTYILSKLARQHVKVALSADGGDEQFCGYESYRSYSAQFDSISRIPLLIRKVISNILKRYLPYNRLISNYLSLSGGMKLRPQLIARYEKMLTLMKIENLSDLLRLMNEKAWHLDTVQSIIPATDIGIFDQTELARGLRQVDRDDLIDRMMRNDYKMFLRDDILTKVDRASMAVSLECRDPMLDHRIAEMAFQMPLDFLFHKGVHKHILKHILKRYVSDDIIRSPKRGFMIPLYYWLKNVWKPIVMEHLSQTAVKAVGVLNPRQVEAEVKRFYRYEGYSAEKIWMMLNFQMWAQKWYLQ